MAEASSYSGGCHCGAVRFEVETDLNAVLSCNCSICTKRGALWNFVPTGQFKLSSGEDRLTDYQFNRHVIHHLFCAVCGTESFARGTGPDGSAIVAINVRCLDGIDLAQLTLTPFDGRSK
jgi:hypothetical protein